MKNWKKDASSYANQLKTEKKVHWPLNISAFVSFFFFFPWKILADGHPN